MRVGSRRCHLLGLVNSFTIQVWCTRTHTPIFVLHPYLDTDAGDLFSLAWSPQHETVYIGCQNTSLQWFSFRGARGGTPGDATPHDTRKAHRFFDSYPRITRRPADNDAHNGTTTVEETPSGAASPKGSYDVPPTNVVDAAHYGYVYCMALIPSHRAGTDESPRPDDAIFLVTGSGDETIKVCTISPFAG